MTDMLLYLLLVFGLFALQVLMQIYWFGIDSRSPLAGFLWKYFGRNRRSTESEASREAWSEYERDTFKDQPK